MILDGFKGPLCHWPCILVALLRDGRFYACAFASAAVMAEWLQRSVFEGCALHDWRGERARHHVLTIRKGAPTTYLEALRSPHLTRA